MKKTLLLGIRRRAGAGGRRRLRRDPRRRQGPRHAEVRREHRLRRLRLPRRQRQVAGLRRRALPRHRRGGARRPDEGRVRADDRRDPLHRADLGRDRRAGRATRPGPSPATSTSKFTFAGVNYYDGQGFMVSKDLGVTSALELDGATVCVQTGTTTELNLADFFKVNNISYQPVPIQTPAEADQQFLGGACDAYTTDASQLATQRGTYENPDNYVILPEIISKEPLGPVVRQGDDQWADIVRWTLLRAGRRRGVRRDRRQRRGDGAPSENPEIRRLLGAEGDLGHDVRPRRRLGEARDHGRAATTARSSPRPSARARPRNIARGLNAPGPKAGCSTRRRSAEADPTGAPGPARPTRAEPGRRFRPGRDRGGSDDDHRGHAAAAVPPEHAALRHAVPVADHPGRRADRLHGLSPPGWSTTPSRTSPRSARTSASASSAARAGYDISQTLIPYTNDSTHARAALVGIVNTLLVAFVGCILATVIGVLMGVLRLSNELDRRPARRRSTSTASATSRCCSGSSRPWRSSPTWRRRRRRSAATTPPPRCCSARSRSPTAASTCPGRCSAPAGTSWSAAFIASLIAIMLFGRWAAKPAGGDRRDPSRPSGSSSALFFLPVLIVDRLMGGPITPRLPRAAALQLPGRRLHRQVVHRADPGAVALHRRLHRRERPRRHPGGLARPDRGGRRARASGRTG